jgi:uncharacterized membrane protein
VFDLVRGLPVHPLVVHAVVVLLPLAVLGTLAIALRPDWRRRYGVLVLVCTAAATALIPVATSSGEQLERRVGDPGDHAALGDQLIWFAAPLLVLVVALVWLQRRSDRKDSLETSVGDGRVGAHRTLVVAVAALACLVALANAVQVYRVGDSGAKAAWGDRVSSSSGPR